MRPARLLSALLTAAVGILASSACGPGPVTDPGDPVDVALVLDASGSPVSAAVLDLVGVDSITAVDGEAIARRRGEVLRAVLFLRVPGQLRLRVVPSSGQAAVAGTVVEASGAEGRPLGSATGLVLRVEP